MSWKNILQNTNLTIKVFVLKQIVGKLGFRVYSGQPNRVERYTQYDQMDQDSEINGALDTIAEFSTQKDSKYDLPFDIFYKDEVTESEVSAIIQH